MSLFLEVSQLLEKVGIPGSVTLPELADLSRNSNRFLESSHFYKKAHNSKNDKPLKFKNFHCEYQRAEYSAFRADNPDSDLIAVESNVHCLLHQSAAPNASQLYTRTANLDHILVREPFFLHLHVALVSFTFTTLTAIVASRQREATDQLKQIHFLKFLPKQETSTNKRKCLFC
jgi:hypothetical protein